jgi:nucleoside-diphosphate-sugar epimerase
MSKPRHTFITGGCGFFGAWIIRQLLADGERVTVLDLQRETKRWRMIMSADEIARIGFHVSRIDDTQAVLDIVRSDPPDAIIHLAGLQVPTCRENPVAGALVNVVGTLNVFAAAKALAAAGAAPRIVYASSAAVFGSDADYDGGAVSDASVPMPSTHYGAFKLCNEHCARASWIADKIASVGLRPLTVFGPGRDTGLTSFPTRAIAAAVLGKSFDIPFSGPTAYIHMREVAELFIACSRKPIADAKVYTVGGDVADTPAFIRTLDSVVPGAAKLVTCSGGSLPIASRLDDAELRRDFPGLLRLPLKSGIMETVAVFERLKAAGTLTV